MSKHKGLKSIVLVFGVLCLLLVGFQSLIQKDEGNRSVVSKVVNRLSPTKVQKNKEEKGKKVYLTFDDGPCNTTPELLAALDESNVKATFFVTAQFMNKKELIEQIKEIDRRGHTIAIHTYSHDYRDIYKSVDSYFSDFKKMDDIIFEAIGKRSKIFRFPGGSNTGYNAAIRSALIKEAKVRGLVYYDWNAYDGDNDGYEGSELVERAVKESGYTDKSILLMHNIPNKNSVIDGIPEIVKQLKAEGYTFDVLDESVKPIQFSSY